VLALHDLSECGGLNSPQTPKDVNERRRRAVP
jgi:hypothetical protein